MALKNQIQLMTYPDSLGGNLRNLKLILDKHLSKAVSLVHILPPYPSSADRGFAPLTHMEIEPRFGSWGDIKELEKDYELMLDLIAGHVSVQSKFFKDYLKKGAKSEWVDLFSPIEKVYSDGLVKVEELATLDYLLPIPPLITFTFADGTKKVHWKTYMPDQADLDIFSPKTRELMTSFMENLAKHGVNVIRLDGVECIVKSRDQGYHMAPGFWEVLEWFIQTAKSFGMDVLSEVHASLEIKQQIIDRGAYVYDFNLPELILNAIYRRSSKYLKDWFPKAPKNSIAVLTNHDGLAIGRIGETLPQEEIQFTRAKIFEHAGDTTKKASGLGSNNIAVDAINATLYEAVYRDQEAWLLAQTLLLFAPGIPQVYYNDLLAQRNDDELYEHEGEGRSLIRHNHSMERIDHKFARSFIRKLIHIMEFRNSYPAFDGELTIDEDEPDEILSLTWQNGEHRAHFRCNFDTWFLFEINYWDSKKKEMKRLEI